MNEIHSNRALPILGILLLLGLAVLVSVLKQQDKPPDDWVDGWLELNAFFHPRRALAAVSSGGYLYVLGGVDAQNHYVRPVEYAPILADGRLGPWQETSSLLEGRFYLAAVSHGGYLYALGGGGGQLGDDNVPLASVERAKINPDGSLQAWQRHSYLSTPRRGLQATVINGRLYAIGGYSGQFLKSSELISLLPQGQPAEWRQAREEARVDRYIHATATQGNRIYLLGGHVEKGGPMSYGDVEMSTVRDNGQLAEWQVMPSRLLTPRFIASAFAIDNYLYIVGGHNGIRRLDSVEMARVTAQGKVGQWTSQPPLNHKRSATAVASNGNTIYIAGGMDDQGVLRSVEMAQLGLHGQLGYRIRKPQTLAPK